MKNLTSTMIKFVLAVAGVAMVLVIINVMALLVWMIQNPGQHHTQIEIKTVASAITKEKEHYIITEEGKKIIDKKYVWGMLIDKSGKVVWSRNLPNNMPKEYSISEIAGFSKWYLKDYPVSVWEHTDGIVVLGDEKDSYWKYNIEYDMDVINKIPEYGIYFLSVNMILALLLAFVLGWKVYHSLKPLAKGIEKLSKKEETVLATTGVLGDLAEKINETSQILKKQEQLLEKRDYARLNWIRGISHDIRTPLSMIMGYAAQIEEEESLIDSRKEQAAIIRKQSIKIRDLVNDLNLASKLEYDMQPLTMKKIIPAEMIRQVVVSFLNDKSNEKTIIELDISNTAQGCCIMGDSNLLTRALINLIANSIIHNTKMVEIKVTARCIEGYYEIGISDNGKGVTKEKLIQLCTSYNQRDIDKNIELPHGMGLFIVQKIIQAHKGKWSIISEEGKGFRYTMEIPLEK